MNEKDDPLEVVVKLFETLLDKPKKKYAVREDQTKYSNFFFELNIRERRRNIEKGWSLRSR